MKIAVISDIHENFHNLVSVLEIIRQENCDYILCLGDYCNPGIVNIILALEIETYFIWGDNDGKKVKITKNIQASKHAKISDDTYSFLEIDGLKICMTHFSDLGKIIAESHRFDLVFCGHTHELFEEQIGKTLCVNPGEISTHKSGICSFYIYDSQEQKGKHVYIKVPLNTVTEKVESFKKSFKK